MNTYVVYLVSDTIDDIIVEADSFELSPEKDLVYFKKDRQLVGVFRMSELTGVSIDCDSEND